MIHQWLQPILDYFHQHPHMGQLFAFLVAFSESLPLIGTIIPGSVTMTAIGTLIGAAILPGFSTLGIAALGAFCGDTVGWWVGYKYNHQLRKVWPFKTRPHWLTSGEAFFKKHGGKSIILGRFIGPARSTVPLIAGLLKMRYLKFALAAFPSAIMWAILYMVPGILLGALSLELPPGKTTEFILGGLVVIVILWLIFWVIQRFFVELTRFVNRRIDVLWNWCNRHYGSHSLIQYITNREKPDDHHQLGLLIISGFLFLLFLLLAINVVAKTTLINANVPLYHFFQSIRNHSTDTFFIIITLLGSAKAITIAGILCGVLLCLFRQWRAGLHFLTLVFGTAAVTLGIKHFFYSARPITTIHSSSFPSGHTTMSLIVYTFLAFLINRKVSYKYHWIGYVCSIIFALLVGFSRLYLGAHWLTDVIGSFLLGSATLLFIIMHYRRMPSPSGNLKLGWKGWTTILIVGLATPVLANTVFFFHKTRKEVMPIVTLQYVSSAQWWQQPAKYLPIYRNNRFGTPYQPFNVQWAGKLHHIRKALLKQGWIKVSEKRFTMKGTFARLANKAPQYHLPLFPWLYRHQPPTLIMIKHIKGSQTIFEIRLWQSFLKFTDSKKPLWIGAVNLQMPLHKLLTLEHHHPISFKSMDAIKKLANSISKHEVKIIQIPVSQQPKKVRQLEWNGELLVVRDRSAD